MQESDVYAAPKSEVINVGKFERFGGWLRFYQVINIISLVLIAVTVGMVGFYYFFDDFNLLQLADVNAAILESLPGLIVALLVLRILTTPNKGVPQKIVKYLGYYIAASLIIFAFVFYLYHSNVIAEKPSSFWGSLIYYWIWSSYFKKSKRVKVYYGDNAVA